MSKLKALNYSIIFQFLEQTDNALSNKTDWGFEIKDGKKDLQVPRWGKVISTGKDVKIVKETDYILIEPLMWTLQIEVDKEKYWSTNETKVIFTTDAKSETKI